MGEHPPEGRVGQIGAAQVRSSQVAEVERRTPEGRTTEVRAGEVAHLEVVTVQRRLTEVLTGEGLPLMPARAHGLSVGAAVCPRHPRGGWVSDDREPLRRHERTRPEGVRHAGHMTSVLANIAVDCTDPDRLAQFWCAVLGWEVLESDDGIVSIGLPDGPGSGPGHPAGIDLLEVAEPTAGKNRLHLDLRATSGASAQGSLPGSSRSARPAPTSART